MSTITDSTGQQISVTRGTRGNLIVSISSDVTAPSASIEISETEWASLTSDIDVPRRVIVMSPRGERCDIGEAFARGRETLPGSLTMLRVWWESADGREVSWSDDRGVCTKWEFEEVLADAQPEHDLGVVNGLS